VIDPHGKRLSKTLTGSDIFAQIRGHPTHHLVHRREAFDLETTPAPRPSRLRHLRQIVPQQVDDHHILGPLFRVGGEFGNLCPVRFRVGAARRGALHRLRLDGSPAEGEELLGAQRQQPASCMPHHSGPPCPRLCEAAHNWPAAAHHLDVAAKSQIRLVEITREQMLTHVGRRGEIILARYSRRRLPRPTAGCIAEHVLQLVRHQFAKTIEQAEPQERSLTMPGQRPQLRLQRICGVIGDESGGMSARRNRLSQPVQRRLHLVNRMCGDLFGRPLIQPRTCAAGAHVVE
jgi:hypothetical protein